MKTLALIVFAFTASAHAESEFTLDTKNSIKSFLKLPQSDCYEAIANNKDAQLAFLVGQTIQQIHVTLKDIGNGKRKAKNTSKTTITEMVDDGDSSPSPQEQTQFMLAIMLGNESDNIHINLECKKIGEFIFANESVEHD